MLTALRPHSIGEHSFERGDEVPVEVQADLPPGRLESLKSQRYVEERDLLPERIADLEARIERLEKANKPARKKVSA